MIEVIINRIGNSTLVVPDSLQGQVQTTNIDADNGYEYPIVPLVMWNGNNVFGVNINDFLQDMVSVDNNNNKQSDG